MSKKRVVIVGGGFAGMGCACKLIEHQNIEITLIDKNNYHHFTPLLYQVATSSLSPDAAAASFRNYFAGKANINIKMATATSVDPKTLTVKTVEGESYSGDYLVLAAGSVVNFFNTPGAEQYSLPLYTLIDAERLRSRIIRSFEEADRNPQLIDQGVLNFVIVGGGPTGTEVSGALVDMLRFALPKEFKDLVLNRAKIYLVNHGSTVLGAFSKESQNYAAKELKKRGVELVLGVLAEKITDSSVELSNGEIILTKTVIWAGGLKAPSFAEQCGLPQGHAGRIQVLPDLTVEGFPNIYSLGDFAIIPGTDSKPLPQLASVAKQAGEHAANNILAKIQGKKTVAFKYDDKGIMAMIGKNAAVVEIGEKRHEFKGFFAYWTWLSVHLSLLATFSQKVQTCIDWILDCCGRAPAFQILDRDDKSQIQWKDNTHEEKKL
jgi:NADH dehydrogenase